MAAMMFIRKGAESAALWSTGDILSQLVTTYTDGRDAGIPSSSASASSSSLVASFRAKYDPMRTGRAALYSFFIFTPIATRWYATLLRWFPEQNAKTVIKRVICDQIVFGTNINACYFICMPLLEGKPERIRPLLQDVWIPATLRGWCWWAPVQMCNLYLTPPKYWMLVINSAAIPWTCFLAYANSKKAGAS